MKIIKTLLWLVPLAVVSCGRPVNPQRVVANPIDLNYAFHVEDTEESLLSSVPEEYLSQVTPEQKGQMIAMLRARLGGESGTREAADPVVQLYDDRYYLFPSKSKGYWSSPDMQHWDYVPCQKLPIDLYAPTVMVYEGELYWMVSDINELYKTTDPEDGESWELVTDHLVLYPDQPEKTGHDPDLFVDDDGKVYLYWGCSNVDVISGIQLDPDDCFAPVGKEVVLITHREKEFGWEQPGDKNEMAAPGYNEGPNIFKHEGKYYLHYAAPGTQYDSYGDGLYVSDSPLGPFEHVEYSPVSVKPGVIKDKYLGYRNLFARLAIYMKRGKDAAGVDATAINVEINQRIALALAPIAFMMLGMPLAIRTSRRETSIGLLLSVALGGLYYGGVLISDALRYNPQFYPQYVVWIPPLLFQLFGVVYLTKIARK